MDVMNSFGEIRKNDDKILVNKSLAKSVRMVLGETHLYDIPFACCVGENTYWNHVAENAHDILAFIPESYLTVQRDNEDEFIHVTSRDNLEKILKCGYISPEFSSDYRSVGQGVYTFTSKSGLRFTGGEVAIVFKTHNKRVSILRCQDTPKAIGEQVFVNSVVTLGEDFKIIEGLDNIREYTENNIGNKEYLMNLYGITEEHLDMLPKNMRENFIESFKEDPYELFSYINGNQVVE